MVNIFIYCIMFLKKQALDIKKLFKEYKAGESLRVLAKRYSYSPTGIRQLMIEFDANRWLNSKRYRPNMQTDKKLVPKLFIAFKSGMTLKDLAAKFGKNKSTIRQLLILHDQQQYKNLKNNRGRPQMDVSREKKIIQLFKQGKSSNEIGILFNLSQERIRQIADLNGLVHVRRRKKEIIKTKIIEELKRGKSSLSIAKKYHFKKNTIEHWRIDNNIPSDFQRKIKVRKEEIINLFKRGIPHRAIARTLGINVDYIRKTARLMGINVVVKKSKTPKIITLLKRNLSPQQIAEKLKITRERVYQVRKEIINNKR